MSPRLTIAIPTLNRSGLLIRAIESALAQTSDDLEILVSDNGSTDDTESVINRYAGRGLRTFHHPATISAPKHGQFLIDQARGEFFLGLSDDDFLEPEFAEQVLAMFDRHPQLSFVYTGCAIHYEDCVVPALVGPALEPGAAFLANHYTDDREVCWCACVTRLEGLRKIGPIPENRIIGDMFYWTKLAFRGPVGCISRVLSHYILLRSKNDNISHGTPPIVWARESRLLADEVIKASIDAGADSRYLSTLIAACRSHIARSTANQFVWTRIKGASWSRVWRWTPSCVPYLSWNLTVLSRIAAALLLPREPLRRLLLSGAARVARERYTNDCKGP